MWSLQQEEVCLFSFCDILVHRASSKIPQLVDPKWKPCTTVLLCRTLSLHKLRVNTGYAVNGCTRVSPCFCAVHALHSGLWSVQSSFWQLREQYQIFCVCVGTKMSPYLSEKDCTSYHNSRHGATLLVRYKCNFCTPVRCTLRLDRPE